MKFTRHLSMVAWCALSTSLCLQAADWPQYRGPNLDGSTSEKMVGQWPKEGLKPLWKVPTPNGFSSFTVSQGKALTLVMREVDGVKQEVCVALDANSGKELWNAPLGVAKYDGGGDSGTDDNKGGDGPRSTPSIDGKRVYTLSANLVLNCFDLESGKSLWLHDLLKEYAGRNITWKNAASPLVEGNLVFVAGGGEKQGLLAFDKSSGALAWKGQDDKMTHATPVATTLLGMRQVIYFTQSGLVSVVPNTGEVLWRYAFPYKVSTAASPVVGGDIVYCSAGYGVGAGAVKVTKNGAAFEAKEIWRVPGDKALANHWSTPVYKDGFLYGMFSFKKYGSGPMKCVELATGKEMWVQEGFGAGNSILVGNQVVSLTDAGDLVLVEANPKAYTETARFQAVQGKCWSTPTLSNGRLYVRSTKEGASFDVALKLSQQK